MNASSFSARLPRFGASRVAPPAGWPERVAALGAFAVFCATLTYWTITLATPLRQPDAAVAATPEPTHSEAAGLLGGNQAPQRPLKLVGVLSLDRGRAAAIIDVGGTTRVITAGRAIDNDNRLVEVRGTSIVVEANGARSEIPLNTRPAGGAAETTVYVR
ncbi:hypothetical protein [Chitinasiproducens palmae]|uniref:General secretion pathway protein C n=1 Tax=Chitinasiproducens palmae TaxID=1770053 RepID=A0A1H2PP26_9BURK|nr:hypothetical protein [Chitinasiproducens palmae]SDV48489.1 general secretion pathway protein C [Chitinasiproducens palmae]